MAIVKMKKITLIGLEKDKESILEKLMKLGVVEMMNFESEAAEGELAELVTRDGDEAAVGRLDSEISGVKSAIDYLAGYGSKKKGLFAPKRMVDSKRFHEVAANRKKLWDIVEQIGLYDGQLSALKAEENRLLNLVASLTPWRAYHISLEISSTKSTVLLTGVMPLTSDLKKLEQEMREQAPESCVEVVNSDADQYYLLVFYHKTLEEAVSGILKQYGFSKVSFKDLEGTPETIILRSNGRIKDIAGERAEIEKRIAALSDERENLEILYDDLVIRRDKKRALDNLVKTDRTFMLKGWLPADAAGKVASDIEEQFDCVPQIDEPGKDEEYPVLLKNNSFVKPFEMITELYSLPNSREIDPNAFMAPFYFVFFGMMISDAGYGLVMALATGLILKRYKPQGMAYKLIKMLFFGGISTFIWGVLFGGWFGDIAKVISGGQFEIKPLWFNPLGDPMKLLLWSFIFGGVHIFTGMGLKAYMLIRDGHWLDALLDIGSWYLVLIGLTMLGAGGAVGGGTGKLVGETGKYMAIAGVAVLVLTQGRGEKNIVKRFVSGVLSLYNVTGYLSDILSYSRLLALGLATGVIASVINTMGSLFGLNIGGIIILAVVFVIGTVFNIAINALGAYVHSSRLQYVEFFGKFFEGGGKAFQPFKINTKYINIK